MRARVVAAALGAAALLVGPSAVAQADVVPGPAIAVTGDDEGEVVVDVSEEDGTWSGSLEVTNASDAVVELAVAAKSGLAEDCAPPEVSPDQVEANRVQSVTVEVSCEVPDGGAVVVLTLGPDDNQTVDVTLEPATSEAPDWGWLAWAAGGSFLVAALLLLAVLVWVTQRPLTMGDDGTPGQLVRWRTPVTGAPTGWSFSESWASNFTAVLALLTALFGSGDMLEALLGTAPDGTEAQLLVSAALAALLVGVAPLALKLVGPTSTPTVGGILVGALLTLTGSLVQVLALGWVLRDSDLAGPVQILAALAALFLVAYSARSLVVLFREAFPPPTAPLPAAVSDLLLVAAAIALGPGAPGTSVAARLDEALIGARDHLAQSGSAPPASSVQGILPTSVGDSPLPPPLPALVL